jgi:hypothetical protein
MPRSARIPALTALLLLAAAAAAPAQPSKDDKQVAVVFLKDGFVLQGYVRQETELMIDDHSRAPIPIPKGYYYLDDVARRLFFSHHYAQETQKRPAVPLTEFRSPRVAPFYAGKPAPPMRGEVEAGEWDDDWERSYKFNATGTTANPFPPTVTLTQRMSLLTSQYAWLEATSKNRNPYVWGAAYRTREFSPDTVAALLSKHADVKDKPGLTEEQRADRRFKVFGFFVQAGWIDRAEKELEAIRKDFPDQKERIAKELEQFKKVQAYHLADEIKLAHAAGRHEAARKLLASFPRDVEDARVAAEVRALREQYDTADAGLRRARALLKDLPSQLTDGNQRALFAEAAEAIAAEVTYDHVFKKPGAVVGGRLEPFLKQAERAEAQRKEGKGEVKPGELQSLAVTGWLLGAASAETSPETARRLWRARKMVLEYQKTHRPAAREKLLADYQGQSSVTVEEVARLIAHLPPPEPEANLEAGTVKLTAPGTASRTVTYYLRLPPEYHPGRSYPALLVLRHGDESAEDTLKRWQEEAARHGYVLVAPDWGRGVADAYDYSSEEHATVLDTVRDLRRRFPVDPDRVFLAGFGEGGNMAYDVGLSHPDQFAGVLPMSGQPRYHARVYWQNAQYLPFYCVWGDRMGWPVVVNADEVKFYDGNRGNYFMFNDWIPQGYPAVGITYKGRGVEWFGGELPDMFDWMDRKRRANPLTAVGRDSNGAVGGGEFRTMRAADNRFYWLDVADVAPGCLNDGDKDGWSWRKPPALLCAVIGEGNQIGVRARGIRQVTVWLARGTIDFDKPVTVRVNLAVQNAWNKRKVTPSLTTMLEDFYDRGDRQRLYLARLDLRL